MKLSVTTLGCPEWDLDTIISRLAEYGYDAVDFRGLMGEMNIYKLPEFSTNVKETLKKITDAGLVVSCFSSSARLYTKTEEDQAKNIDEVLNYAKLCRIFGTRYIRVFGGPIGDAGRTAATKLAAKNLKELAKLVRPYDVKLLIETHDDWTDSRYIKALLEEANEDNVRVLWDTHHPIRTLGEMPATTWALIGKWIEYTHWKDSYKKENTRKGHMYCLLGKGEMPLSEIYNTLKKNGYDGYFTLEWEKKWEPSIEEPEIAFPDYTKFMKKLAAN